MKSNKSINEITLFRYLFNLDNRDLPQSIFNWYSNVGSVVDSDRENARGGICNQLLLNIL